MERLPSDLISMGQFMDENKCVVQLADHFLVVQDCSSKMVISAGKRVGGIRRSSLLSQHETSRLLKSGISGWVILLLKSLVCFRVFLVPFR